MTEPAATPLPTPTPGQAFVVLWSAMLSPFRYVATGTASLLGKLTGPLLTAVLTAGLMLSIQASGCLPPPGPPIPPEPKPGPVPSGDFLVGVVDNENRTQELAAILMDDSLGAWLGHQQVKWRIVDKAQERYTAWGCGQALADAKLTPPAMILYRSGQVIRCATEPATSEGVKVFVLGSPVPPGLPTVFANGEARKLACLPPSKRTKALPKGGSWGDAKPMIPRDKWKEIDRRKLFPPDLIFDQDGHGSCVGNGATAALEKVRALTGMTFRKLSPGCTYSQINGGSDNGAVISDSLTALQQTGTVLFDTVGQEPIYTRQMPNAWKEEAKRFRIEEAYRCDTFDEMGSALQLGYIVVYGMQVGNNFGQFTSDGVAGVSRGPGNHCMHADGMHKLPSGKWAFDNVNSWGANWGPWNNGRCYLVEGHFQNGDQPDAYAVKACTEDPQEPIKPKAQKHTAVCPCDKCNCDPCQCSKAKAQDGWRWDESRQVWWRPLPAQPVALPALALPTPTYYPAQSAAPRNYPGFPDSSCRT